MSTNPSIHEQLLAEVKVALLGATDAAQSVARGRVDPFGPDECPAINVRRAAGQFEPAGQGRLGLVDSGLMEFELEIFVRGDDWETAADAIHMQANAALMADGSSIFSIVRGLRCIRTEPYADAGDETIGRLRVTYQAKAMVFVANHGKALS